VAMLSLGVLSAAAYVAFSGSGGVGSAWYLAIAALGTGMAIVGARQAQPPRRRIWAALALGSVLYLVGDALWVLYDVVLDVSPYPSLADAAYLSRYVVIVTGLCWLVRGRQAGRDRAAFLDAAILTSAFALPTTMFFILPIFSWTDTTVLSTAVAAAYPIGDVFVLAVLLRLATGPAARSLSFLSLAAGLLIFLGTDVYYNLVVSWGTELPRWTDGCYLLTYLLIGFAAMHSSRDALSEPTARPVARPVVLRLLALGCSSLFAPGLLAALVLTHSLEDPLVVAIAIGGAVSSALVLIRLLDLLRYSESQSVQLAVLARTDSLTGLANRRSWDHQLARATEDAQAAGTSLTVAMIDLDHFKLYNDTNGHLAGDLALKETAAAWSHALEGQGYIARYGGEEFALFIPGAAHGMTDALVQRIHQSVARGQSCSIGVTEWRPTEQPADAVARADEALYEAKRAGRNRIVRHDADAAASDDGAAAHDLVAFFQPIVDIRTGLTVGREALSRFPGMSAMEAFAQARVTGDTARLERAAIAAALAGDQDPGWLSLNVSLSTILDTDLDDLLPRDLSNIVFEITEYEDLLDPELARERLVELRVRGARMAIDDLGVGFSSLDRLLWLEPEIIKLDVSVVRDIQLKPCHAAMIHALVGYAFATCAQLCAEGVETAEERRVLTAAGVDLAQGYLFGRPEPATSGSDAVRRHIASEPVPSTTGPTSVNARQMMSAATPLASMSRPPTSTKAASRTASTMPIPMKGKSVSG
jgi:diguanylate cyclase (GGDEF)-like protein